MTRFVTIVFRPLRAGGKLDAPERPVVALVGDGAMQMTRFR